jgi:hypothetical protein
LVITIIKTEKRIARCCSVRDGEIRRIDKTTKNKLTRGLHAILNTYNSFCTSEKNIKCHLSPSCTSLQFCSGAWLYVRYFLCCFVLCSQKLCDWSMSRIICRKGLIISELILNWNTLQDVICGSSKLRIIIQFVKIILEHTLCVLYSIISTNCRQHNSKLYSLRCIAM